MGLMYLQIWAPAPRDHSRAPADLYQTQAQWFLEQGVTHFLVETLSGDEGLPELAGWLKEKKSGCVSYGFPFAVDHSGMNQRRTFGSASCIALHRNWLGWMQWALTVFLAPAIC